MTDVSKYSKFRFKGEMEEIDVPIYTKSYLSDEHDGHLTNTGSGYSTIRTAESCNEDVHDDENYIRIGQWESLGMFFKIHRGFIFFDTSNLSPDAEIVSASIKFNLNTDDSNSPAWDIVIQNGQPNYPNKPIIQSDYNYTYYSGDGGSFNTSNLPGVNEDFTIELSEDGISWINKGGITKLCIRSSRDIDGTEATGEEDVSIHSREESDERAPTLTVNYRLPKSISITGTGKVSISKSPGKVLRTSS